MSTRAFARVPVVRAKRAILAILLLTGWLTYRLADVQIRQSGTLSRLALSQHDATVPSRAPFKWHSPEEPRQARLQEVDLKGTAEKATPTLSCSFCGKSQREVRKLVVESHDVVLAREASRASGVVPRAACVRRSL